MSVSIKISKDFFILYLGLNTLFYLFLDPFHCSLTYFSFFFIYSKEEFYLFDKKIKL